MGHVRLRNVLACGLGLLVSISGWAEQGVLPISVFDMGRHPFEHVKIGTENGGSPQDSDQNGRVRLHLATGAKPGEWLTLAIYGGPAGVDLVFVSPDDGRVQVQPWDNEEQNYVRVMLARRGDMEVLRHGSGMLAVHDSINRSIAAQRKKKQGGALRLPGYGQARLVEVAFADDAPDELQRAIQQAAEHFGLKPSEIAAALDDWGGDPLAWKVVYLTGLFEVGQFPFSAAYVTPSLARTDGGGRFIFGAAPWTTDECEVQRLFAQLHDAAPERFDALMGKENTWLYDTKSACDDATDAILRHVTANGKLSPEWAQKFHALGEEPMFQRMQVKGLTAKIQQAEKQASTLGMTSERGVALCYDVMTMAGAGAWKRAQPTYETEVKKYIAANQHDASEQTRMELFSKALPIRRTGNDRMDAFVRDRIAILTYGRGDLGGRHFDLEEIGIRGPRPPMNLSVTLQ